MKKKLPIVLLGLICLSMFFLPALTLHVHSQLGEEIAGAFPASLSLWTVMTNHGLPLDVMPSLSIIHFGSWMLTGGLIFLALGIVLFLIDKKGTKQIGIAFTLVAAALFAGETIHLMNLSGSLLFTVLLTVQTWLFMPLVCCVVLLVLEFLELKGGEVVIGDDKKLRVISGVLAALALIVMLFPVYRVNLPETITGNPGDARVMNRSQNMYQVMLGNESNLYQAGQDTGAFADVLTGDLMELEKLSADATNVKGIFTIRNNTSGMNVFALVASLLLLASVALAFLPKVDRYFPVVLQWLGFVLLATSVLSTLSVGGQQDMYASASRQLILLGLGYITPVPLFAALLAFGSALAGSLGVRYANEPYFINPIPAASRLKFVAVLLAVLSLACILLPGGSVSFSKAGKNKVQQMTEISGWEGMIFQSGGKLANPVDSKGKAIYPEEGNPEDYPVSVVNAATGTMALWFNLLTWLSLIAVAAGMYFLIFKGNRKMSILFFLVAFVLRVITWAVLSCSLPRAVASGTGTVFLYASMPLLVFAAFFANFSHMEELPKKYKLFLMMLPFLLAVFLFSYLPLYGWSYAFYNYKFGLPMDQQEFVGFKWFTEMFTNEANRVNIVRVLKNTFGMSGLNLLTSWLPMVFAIFLNEITRNRFKKFVQIFTTLPNFISWALVFSFAMTLFAMDTGIFSKFMEAIGAVAPDSHIVWLNSSEHIWLKMWGWSTWKGLGWGAIMYLAAIAGIDQELYEAAQVDGANRWHKMRYITLPGLLPTFFVLLMLSISNILNNGMEQYLVFQNPMNKNSIEVLDLYVYNITIASRGTTLYSYATAIGILKTLVSVTLLFSANFASKKLRGESIM